MTLGPALALLPLLERWRDRLGRALVTFGRVPMFFYLVHVPAIHLLAALWSWARYGAAGWWFWPPKSWPQGYSPDLVPAWVVWLLVSAALYPLCARFAEPSGGARRGCCATCNGRAGRRLAHGPADLAPHRPRGRPSPPVRVGFSGLARYL